jgi:GNAT superfamily N-acetyltransferase
MAMWRDVLELSDHPELKSKVEESAESTREWIRAKLSEGKLVGFIARAQDGTVAGSGCIWIRNEQPRPTNPRQENPYLLSMYTEEAFRRKGVGKAVLRSAVEWGRVHRYERVVLHASKRGRPLYEAFGFEPSTEMRLKL